MKEIFDFFLGDTPARRGDRKLKQGNFQEAINEYNQALLLNPNDAMSYGHRGFAFAQLGDNHQGKRI